MMGSYRFSTEPRGDIFASSKFLSPPDPEEVEPPDPNALSSPRVTVFRRFTALPGDISAINTGADISARSIFFICMSWVGKEASVIDFALLTGGGGGRERRLPENFPKKLRLLWAAFGSSIFSIGRISVTESCRPLS